MDRTPDRQPRRGQRLPTSKETTGDVGRRPQVPVKPKLVPLKPVGPVSLPSPEQNVRPIESRPKLTAPTRDGVVDPVSVEVPLSRPKLPTPTVLKPQQTQRPLPQLNLRAAQPSPVRHTSAVVPPTRQPEQSPALSPTPLVHSPALHSLPTLTPPTPKPVDAPSRWPEPERRDWLEMVPTTVAPIRYSDL